MLEVQYKGKNIHEVQQMTEEEDYAFFNAVPSVARKLKTLIDVAILPDVTIRRHHHICLTIISSKDECSSASKRVYCLKGR